MDFRRTWNGWTQSVRRAPPRRPTRVEIDGIQWQAVEHHTQICNLLQAMHDHNDTVTRDMACRWTLPIIDVVYLRKVHGVDAINPRDADEEKWLDAWVWRNRPHLVGKKFRHKRALDLPSKLIKEGS